MRKERNTTVDDETKTKTQLLADVAALRQQLAVLHAAQIDVESSEWFAATLTSIGDAVLTTDTMATITFFVCGCQVALPNC
jgi:ribonuclease D